MLMVRASGNDLRMTLARASSFLLPTNTRFKVIILATLNIHIISAFYQNQKTFMTIIFTRSFLAILIAPSRKMPAPGVINLTTKKSAVA
jgi:hypothetical protein